MEISVPDIYFFYFIVFKEDVVLSPANFSVKVGFTQSQNSENGYFSNKNKRSICGQRYHVKHNVIE